MPYAVVRSQFAENLQVTAPYGRGWLLLAWWPFPPSRICSTNQMPSLGCLLQKLLHFLPVRRYVSSSFAEAQPRRQKKSLLHVLWLRVLLAQRLQIYLSNITVCWRSFVTSRKGMANCPQAIHYWWSVRLE